MPTDQPADVLVINTCSVTSDAESKSRYAVRRFSRTSPNAKVVVTGCAAQMAINKSEDFPGADVLVPNPEKLKSLEFLLRQYPELTPDPLEKVDTQPAPMGRTRATLKIQDGCSVMCSYCSIPYTRPVMTSRPWHEVIEETEKLVGQGYREVVLTGVLIGAYGPETGSQGPDFETLVERISQVPGLARVRISSIEMRQVSDRLIELIQSGAVVPHLHIPLQSGDSGVLKDMNRPYSQADYLALCDRLYALVPEISLTTDVLVGFPTEDETRFASSLHVFEQARFLKAHVFRFSPRFGTPADAFGDPVSPEIKARRSQELTAVSTRTGREHVRRWLGRTVEVLVEKRDRKSGLMPGLTRNYIEVRFTGPESLSRNLAWVRVDEEREGILYGEQVSDPKQVGSEPLTMV